MRAIKRRQNKYGAVKQTYNGRSYHSKKEAAYAMELDWLKKSGEVKEWTPQHKIELRVNGVKVCNYYLDFRVEYSDGRIELVEVKGFATDVWRLKWKLTEALIEEIEPGARLVLVR